MKDVMKKFGLLAGVAALVFAASLPAARSVEAGSIAPPSGAIGDCNIGPTTPGGNGDMSLTIGSTTHFSVACREPVANAGLAQEVQNLNDAFSLNPAFLYLDKDTEASATGLGVTFTVTGAIGGKTGVWGVSWAEAAGSPDLPITADFVIGVFGGSNGAAYYFNDVLLPVSPTAGSGYFEIEFLNKQGTATPGLSHLTLIGGDFTSVDDGGTDPDAIPEPMTLALFGLGLAGLGVASRRRRAA